MEKERFSPWRDLGLVIDVIQAIIVVVATVALTFDSLGFVDIPWLRQNLLGIVFVAVCAQIVSSILERRVVLKSFHDTTNERLEKVELGVTQLKDGVSGFISGDLFLKGRSQYEPMETRMQNAKEVFVIGKTLVGLVAAHRGAILREARRGCVLKFVLCDPSLLKADPESIEDVNRTLFWLSEAKESTPEAIEIRLTKLVLHSSIIAIDYKTDRGKIQVESYPNVATGIRYHFDLTPTQSPIWYDFHVKQIDKIWENSKPPRDKETKSR